MAQYQQKYIKFINILYIIILLFALSCQDDQKNDKSKARKALAKKEKKDTLNAATTEKVDTFFPAFPYRVKDADKSIKLPNSLTEISGLSISDKPGTLFCVNDEKGKVFAINSEDGTILESFKFAKNGDFEGVEQVGNKIYTLKSNGNIYEIQNLGGSDQKTTTYKTELGTKHDVEGLSFYQKENALLLACKANPDKDKGDFKSIYLFDLTTKKLREDKTIRIRRTAIDQYLAKQAASEKVEKLKDRLFSLSDLLRFAPSGIAVHPRLGHLYVLSAVGNLIIVMTAEGEILHIAQIKEKAARQPEGICFEPDGSIMYISSEGKGGKGRLFQFELVAL